MKEFCIKTLKELLDYDCESGNLIWKVKLNRSIKVGSVAGTINKYNKYVIVTINKKKYMAHRIIWAINYGYWPKKEIDHIDHSRSNNKLINLREVTPKENQRNTSLYCNSKSGVMGVNFTKATSRWSVFIKPHDKNLYLGSFDDKFDAICARKSAEHKYGFHKNHGGSR